MAEETGIKTGEEETGEKTPAPQFMTAEQTTDMMKNMAAEIQQNFQQTFSAHAAQAQQATQPKEDEVPVPTYQDIMQAQEEGDFRKANTLLAARESAISNAHTAQVEQLRQEGTAWLGEVQKQQLLDKNTDYAKYKDEVDGLLEQFPAAQRSNPTIVQFVTNSVKGSHVEDIIKEHEEAKLRQENEAKTAAPTHGGHGPTADRDGDVIRFGDAEAAALASNGMDQDSFAKKLGYESWADYQKMAAEYYEKPTHRQVAKEV